MTGQISIALMGFSAVNDLMPVTTSKSLLMRLRRSKRLFPRYGVKKLEIFGSVARGEAKPGSDIDLIATFSKTPGLNLVEFHRELEKSLGLPVDLLDSQTVEDMTNPYRRAAINADRKVIYEKR